MSNEKKVKSFNELSQLENLFSKDELNEIKLVDEKQKYQEDWKRNKSGHRKMVAKKNRRWLIENNQSELKNYVPFPKVYQKIEEYFKDEKKRGYMIHIITNFLPLNRVSQVVLFREENMTCPFTDYKLTDTNSILVGNRDKHIAFSGANSNVYLCGIALQELNRYVLEQTYLYDSREGQIVNFALDKLREELSEKKA
jgi:hypothetical protein